MEDETKPKHFCKWTLFPGYDTTLNLVVQETGQIVAVVSGSEFNQPRGWRLQVVFADSVHLEPAGVYATVDHAKSMAIQLAKRPKPTVQAFDAPIPDPQGPPIGG